MDIASAVKMRLTLQDRLLRRELGESSRYNTIKALYGDRAWVDDLDIVNELGGHTGCVNALSWVNIPCFGEDSFLMFRLKLVLLWKALGVR